MSRPDTLSSRPHDYREARQSRWENEGGALRPATAIAAAALAMDRGAAGPSAPERPRLYADLLDEAGRQRRAADDIIVRGMVAMRDPAP